MNPFAEPHSRAFERAFVATRYLLGVRKDALLLGLGVPSQHAKEWVERLSHADRRTRGEALGVGLGHVTRSLDRRRIR